MSGQYSDRYDRAREQAERSRDNFDQLVAALDAQQQAFKEAMADTAGSDCPYGSLCGEGYSETLPSDSDLLTVIPALRNMLVAAPQKAARLIEAYLPIAPDPPRRCSRALYNHIVNDLAVCRSYCAAVSPKYLMPCSLMWWFLDECDLARDAIIEHALAVVALQEEIKRIYPPPEAAGTADARMRPVVFPLSSEPLDALSRATRGTQELLAMYERVLTADTENAAALGCVFKNITSLKAHWEPVFGSYRRLACALDLSPAVPQRLRGQRREVEVAAFHSWLDSVKSLGAANGIDPNDAATWTDAFWNAVSLQFAAHLREKRTRRDQEYRQDG
jgi:hypothetical protein